MNNQLNNKLTSYEWERKLGLKLLDLKGFESQKYYDTVQISKEDFLLRAANCAIERPATQTRRESSKLKKFLSFGIK